MISYYATVTDGPTPRVIVHEHARDFIGPSIFAVDRRQAVEELRDRAVDLIKDWRHRLEVIDAWLKANPVEPVKIEVGQIWTCPVGSLVEIRGFWHDGDEQYVIVQPIRHGPSVPACLWAERILRAEWTWRDA